MKNRKSKGLLKFFVYFDKKDQEYVGVCVDLCIIKTGQNPYVVENDLKEASMGYIEAVSRDKDFSDKLLNQKLPEKYQNIFDMIIEVAVDKKKVLSKPVSFDNASFFYQRIPSQLCHAI